LLLAVILWLYVSEKNKPEKYITVPLKLKNIPTNTTISSNYKNIVLIQVKGKESVIRYLSARDFKAFVNLKNGVLGKNKVKIDVNSDNKGKFKIVKMHPESIVIYLDKLSHKEVPVSATIINSPAEGYKKISEIVTPDKIVIKGPKKVIDNINVIRTEPIDIGGVTGSIYKEVNLDIPSEFVSPVDYKNTYISINIIKNFKTQVFNNKQVVIKNLLPKFYIKNIDDLKVDIKIYGPPTRIKTIENNDFLYIDAQDIKSDGKYEKSVSADLPRDCSIVYIKPEKIELKVEVK